MVGYNHILHGIFQDVNSFAEFFWRNFGVSKAKIGFPATFTVTPLYQQKERLPFGNRFQRVWPETTDLLRLAPVWYDSGGEGRGYKVTRLAAPHYAKMGGGTMLYLIAYDLIGERKDYEAVERVIQAASKGKYVRCLKSTWLLRSEIESIHEMKDLLESFMDSDDQFLVTEITGKLRGRLPQRVWDAWDSING